MRKPTNHGLTRRSFNHALTGGALMAGVDAFTGACAMRSNFTMNTPFHTLAPLDGRLLLDDVSRDARAQDYGQLVHERPRAVLEPGSVEDIARVVRFARRHGLRIAARGHGHQPFGQAQVSDGIVVDMSSLASLHSIGSEGIDIDAGADWRTVARTAFEYGLTPPVLTNYLGLTIGGTLSIGGIGLASFRSGAQVDQVQRLEVVTGRGDIVICSRTENRDLFEAVLAGQGQSGIIAPALLRAEPVKTLVREYMLPFPSLESLVHAGERVRDDGRFDGFAALIMATPSGWPYALSATHFHDASEQPDDAALLQDLQFIAGAEQIRSVSYLESVDVTPPFDPAQAHADLGLFVPQSASHGFIEEMLSKLTPEELGTAKAMRLFFLKSAAFSQPLLRLPQTEHCNYIAILRTETNDSDTIARMLRGNRILFERCRDVGGTLYPFAALEMSPNDWRDHYGPRWHDLIRAKRRYDPENVFASGPPLNMAKT